MKAQQELREKVGKPAKREVKAVEINEELKSKVEAFAKAADAGDQPQAALPSTSAAAAYKELSAALKVHLPEGVEDQAELSGEVWGAAKRYFDDLQYHTVRNMILDEGVRLDGRKTDEVRGLAMEVDYLPGPHGSALFTRGETQSLTTATLGTSEDELLVESAAVSNYSELHPALQLPAVLYGRSKAAAWPRPSRSGPWQPGQALAGADDAG